MRILKWILKITLGLLLLVALSYGVFHLVEYFTGSKYIKYLTKNSETIPLDQNFSYSIMNEDISKSKLILAGEIHGFKEPCKFDIDFFKYLHKEHDVNHYIAELDFLQAKLINDFLESGDEGILKTALSKWAVTQGRNNKDYFNKYIELHKYYISLPGDNKFKIIGIDRIQDIALFAPYLNQLLPNNNLEKKDSIDSENLLGSIEKMKVFYKQSPDTSFILSHLESNLKYVQEKMGREEVMFQNFSSLYTENNLKESRIYGYFGLYHVFQYRVDGEDPLASKIRQSNLGLENKILSLNFMMNDSYMVMPSKNLPEFIRDPGKYTRMPVSADNMLIMYIYGIKDFKRMTPLHSKSLIKMNGVDSPYSNTNRLNTTIQILPVADIFELTDKGKPYVQYTVFVRNSDWAEPMEE